MSNKIELKKDIYEAKQARDILDEEFSEFLPLQRSIKEFFDIYDKKFYSILTSTHTFFIEKSLNYIKTFTNPRQITIDNLNAEIEDLEIDIASMEKFHPILPNNIVIAPKEAEGQSISDSFNYPLFLMQSGKARQLIGPNKISLFKNIKLRQKVSRITDEDFIIIIPGSTNSIPKGKPIETEADLNDNFLTLNTYNGPTTFNNG